MELEFNGGAQVPLGPISFSTSGQPLFRPGLSTKKVRVYVKVSLAEGRRRLHTNMAYARLLIFNRPSCGVSPTEGRRCST